jgi:hypothetical protein
MIIGIDFGGVLSIDDTIARSPTPHRNTTVDMPGAKEALADVSKDHKLFLISFCGKRRAMETKASIIAAGLDKYFAGLYFVKHPDYKSHITRYLGCNAMIDDSEGVLNNIRIYDDKIYTVIFGTDTTITQHISIASWYDVSTAITNLTEIEITRDDTIDISRLCYTV